MNYYYVVAALIFHDGKIRDGVNFVHQSENPSSILDFRQKVANSYTGAPETYSAIIISYVQEISQGLFNEMSTEFGRLINDAEMRRINEQQNI